jgi:hypothetical protein
MSLSFIAFVIITAIALSLPGKRKRRRWDGDTDDWSGDSSDGDSDGGDSGVSDGE